jgi:hypothetical protein
MMEVRRLIYVASIKQEESLTIIAPLLYLSLIVMGGRSNTNVEIPSDSAVPCLFTGTINTNGGGFCSIRANLEKTLPDDAKGIKIKFKGDGNTYKILLSKGQGAGGPMSKNPSWQADLPTTKNEMEEKVVTFDSFLPSFGGRKSLTKEEMSSYHFKPSEMAQLGIMLSLKLANGDSNPPETFGQSKSIFDFHFEVHELSIV